MELFIIFKLLKKFCEWCLFDENGERRIKWTKADRIWYDQCIISNRPPKNTLWYDFWEYFEEFLEIIWEILSRFPGL